MPGCSDGPQLKCQKDHVSFRPSRAEQGSNTRRKLTHYPCSEILRPTATPGQLGVPWGSLSLANRRKLLIPCGRMRPRLTQGDSSPRALCAAMHPQQRQQKRPRWCISEWEQCTGWPLTKTVTPGTTSLANAPLLNLRPTNLANPPHPDPSQAKTPAELREPSTPENTPNS